MLGLGVLAAAYPVLSALKVRQLARPLMREFAAYAGGTVSIAMPFGLDFIYVETLRTTDAVPHVPDVGFTGALSTTAVGRALLSLYTEDELEGYVAKVKAERPQDADYARLAAQALTPEEVEQRRSRWRQDDEALRQEFLEYAKRHGDAAWPADDEDRNRKQGRNSDAPIAA